MPSSTELYLVTYYYQEIILSQLTSSLSVSVRRNDEVGAHQVNGSAHSTREETPKFLLSFVTGWTFGRVNGAALLWARTISGVPPANVRLWQWRYRIGSASWCADTRKSFASTIGTKTCARGLPALALHWTPRRHTSGHGATEPLKTTLSGTILTWCDRPQRPTFDYLVGWPSRHETSTRAWYISSFLRNQAQWASKLRERWSKRTNEQTRKCTRTTMY